MSWIEENRDVSVADGRRKFLDSMVKYCAGQQPA